MADECFQSLIGLHVVLSHEGYRSTGLPSSRSSPNSEETETRFEQQVTARYLSVKPMDVVFAVRRNIEVDDHVHVWNVQSPRGDVCRNQNIALSRLKFVDRSQSFHLRELTMQTNGIEPQVSKQQGDAKSIVAGGSKDYYAFPFALVKDESQIAIFPFRRYEKVLL